MTGIQIPNGVCELCGGHPSKIHHRTPQHKSLEQVDQMARNGWVPIPLSIRYETRYYRGEDVVDQGHEIMVLPLSVAEDFVQQLRDIIDGNDERGSQLQHWYPEIVEQLELLIQATTASMNGYPFTLCLERSVSGRSNRIRMNVRGWRPLWALRNEKRDLHR